MAHFRSLQEPESIKGKTSYKSIVVGEERIQPAMSSQAKLEWNFKWHFMEKQKQTGLKMCIGKKRDSDPLLRCSTPYLFPTFRVDWQTLNSPTENIFSRVVLDP